MDILSKLYRERTESRLETFNENLLYGDRSDTLVHYLLRIFKDYEKTGYHRMISHELITDERYIDSDKYELHKYLYKSKNSSLENTRTLDDSRYNLLRITFAIEFDGNYEEEVIELLLPKPYRKYYYLINGKKLYPIYQIVENSTYNKTNSVVMKTLRTPMQLTNKVCEMVDVFGEFYSFRTHTIFLSRLVNPILYYLAKMGLVETLDYLCVSRYIRIVGEGQYQDKIDSGELIAFKISNKLFMLVDREEILENQYLQACATMLYNEFTSRTGESSLDKEYWVKKLGAVFTATPASQLAKGYSVLSSFEISLDGVTEETLKLDDIHKSDTYALVRWMMMNFDELMLKDNLDINNKRVRIAEYLAAEIATKVSANLYRLLSENKISMKLLKGVLNINPMMMIFRIQTSPLLRYDNSVNDMTVWNALKYTFKGISAMGGSSGRISQEYRRIHPSHIGKLDINSSSNTDPGLTGTLCPMADMKTLHFEN
ncbi:MAG: hypothetical protein ACRCXT_10645, partial [Paraclostridium sp.]